MPRAARFGAVDARAASLPVHEYCYHIDSKPAPQHVADADAGSADVLSPQTEAIEYRCRHEIQIPMRIADFLPQRVAAADDGDDDFLRTVRC